MTALSASSIIKRLSTNSLVVSPLLDAKQIGPSSIDLRMGNVALISRAGSQSHVDPAAYVDNAASLKHGQLEVRQQKHDRYDIPFGKKLLLHPGALVLVPTLEWVSIPNDLQGIVTARSSWAREGLSIATATIINPGYRGIITLELANLGQIPILLLPGLRLAQLALYELQFEGAKPKASIDGQFSMSFEPSAGNIAQGDEIFIQS